MTLREHYLAWAEGFKYLDQSSGDYLSLRDRVPAAEDHHLDNSWHCIAWNILPQNLRVLVKAIAFERSLKCYWLHCTSNFEWFERSGQQGV